MPRTHFYRDYAYFKFLNRDVGPVSPLLHPQVCAFLLFVVVFALEALLQRKVGRRIGIVIIEIAALLAPFYTFDERSIIASAIVALLFFFVGYLQCRRELELSTTIRFFRSTHGVVAKAVTATLLIGILLYIPMASSGQVFISESGFSGFFNWAAGLANDFYPKISFTGLFGNFAQSVATEEFAGNVAFAALSPSGQGVALSAATNQIEGSLSKSLDMTISAASPMSDVAYRAIITMLQGWRVQFSMWFTVGWAIVLFFALRSIGVVFVWIGQFLTMVAYELLLAAGVIRITEEPQTKEIIGF